MAKCASVDFTSFVLWQSKIKVSLDFTLGLQPVFQLVTWLLAAGLKDLISMFADEIGQAFNGTTTGVRTIMNAGSTLIC
jgi:hypothetical protein